MFPVLRQSPLVVCARFAGNISRARRQRLISVISMIMVLMASISMVLIAGSSKGATGPGSDITPVAPATTSQRVDGLPPPVERD